MDKVIIKSSCKRFSFKGIELLNEHLVSLFKLFDKCPVDIVASSCLRWV